MIRAQRLSFVKFTLHDPTLKERHCGNRRIWIGSSLSARVRRCRLRNLHLLSRQPFQFRRMFALSRAVNGCMKSPLCAQLLFSVLQSSASILRKCFSALSLVISETTFCYRGLVLVEICSTPGGSLIWVLCICTGVHIGQVSLNSQGSVLSIPFKRR